MGFKYTQEELINLLIYFYNENGKAPTQNDFLKNPKYPHFNTFKNTFKMTWNEILKKAGLHINQEKNLLNALSKDEILKKFKIELARIQEEIGKIPNREEYNIHTTFVSERVLNNKFKSSWNDLLIKAGFDKQNLHGTKLLEEEIVSIIIDKTRKLDRTPFEKEMTDKILLQIRTMGYNWNEFLKKHNILTNYEPITREYISKKEMINDLIFLYEKIEETPTKADCVRAFKKGEIRSSDFMYYSVFGTWNKALQEAGIPINRSYKLKYNKDEIVENIKQLYFQLGRRPTVMEIEESSDLPKGNTIKRYFGVSAAQVIEKIEKDIITGEYQIF